MVRSKVSDWIGLEISGRYKVLGRVGQGSMGHIFSAYDRNLQTDVVLKVPVSQEAADDDQGFRDRFSREVRSLVTLSHPHIVKIIDVGEFESLPFVVMQYLTGGSLKDRMTTGPQGETRPMELTTLRDWLLEIARALDFIHSQQHIHRDVKPANILFDSHGNAFLGDFGIIKALTSEETDWKGNSLTAPGFLVGTPNYVAPEIVMGRPFDGRVDQYSLAMTVFEVLTGMNCMEGPTPSATVVNQTMVVPPALSEVVPGTSSRISQALHRGLAKEPQARYETCTQLAQEILADVPTGSARTAVATQVNTTSRGQPGRVPCPACGEPIPAGREHAGSRLRCHHCEAVSQVQMLSPTTLLLRLVQAAATTDPGEPVIIDAPESEPEVDSSAATVTVPVERPSRVLPAAALAADPGRTTTGRSSALALALSLAGVGLLGILAVSGFVLSHRGPSGETGPKQPGGPALASAPAESDGVKPVGSAPGVDPAPVEIHIAYGTEKQKWLEQAAAEFQKTEAGKRIKLELHGMGSVEGAQAVLHGPAPVPFHVWSPASSAYRDVFEREWRAKHKGSPILQSENLALTPMVFVMWESRHEPFARKYGKVTFQTIAAAIAESGGWESIGGESGWGRFKFGHTHPNQSNSGLLTLVLMAYEFSKKERNLALDDISQPGFVKWLRTFEQGVARPSGTLSHSTGTLMRDMVLRGPSQYDCLMIYENLAIDYLDAARDHWGELHVDYPEPNMWNEHPYYILDVPWSQPPQRAAAAEFLRFLMSQPIQRRALEHGFRPGNPEISIRNPDSPFLRHVKQGMRIDLPRMCEPPRAETVKKLVSSFEQNEQ
jgi:serine/threonine-protein kinase